MSQIVIYYFSGVSKAADLGEFDKQRPCLQRKTSKGGGKAMKTLEDTTTFIIYESFLFYGLASLHNKPLK